MGLTFVLILAVFGSTDRPALTTVEFYSRSQCEDAGRIATAGLSSSGRIVSDRKPLYVCVEKGNGLLSK